MILMAIIFYFYSALFLGELTQFVIRNIHFDNFAFKENRVFENKYDQQVPLYDFIQSNFDMPKAAMELAISGLIYIDIIIDEFGNPIEIKSHAKESEILGHGLEEECIRVLKSYNRKWSPEFLYGVPKKSFIRFPFQIDNSGGF